MLSYYVIYLKISKKSCNKQTRKLKGNSHNNNTSECGRGSGDVLQYIVILIIPVNVVEAQMMLNRILTCTMFVYQPLRSSRGMHIICLSEHNTIHRTYSVSSIWYCLCTFGLFKLCRTCCPIIYVGEPCELALLVRILTSLDGWCSWYIFFIF